jgi:hypothetical protein
MKNLFLFTFSIFSLSVFAQSHKAGTLSLQGDYEIGILGTSSETKFNETVVDQDTSSAFTNGFAFAMHYSLVEFISAGVYGNFGSYVENEDNVVSNGNQFISFGAGARLYPINNDKFNWYLGGKFGYCGLEINRQTTIIVPFNFDYKYGSTEVLAETGFNWYFANFLGVNFNLNYQWRNLDLKEYSINGSEQNMDNMTSVLKTRGVGVSAGVSLKIN